MITGLALAISRAYLRWNRVRRRSFLYLCLRIFFRRHLITLPIRRVTSL